MKTTIQSLARQVATLLGEAIGVDTFPADSPFPDIENRVRILSPGILSELLQEMPSHLLPADTPISGNFSVDADGVGKIYIPDDFLRLVSIQLSDWEKPVTVVTTDSNRVAMQASACDGVHGTPKRPVALYGIDNYGMRCLKLYSTSPESRVLHALYIPVPKPDSSDSLSYPDSLHSLLIERLASRFSTGSQYI